MKYKIVLKDKSSFEAEASNVYVSSEDITIDQGDIRIIIPKNSISFYIVQDEKKKEEKELEKALIEGLNQLEWKEGISCEYCKASEGIMKHFKEGEKKQIADYEFWVEKDLDGNFYLCRRKIKDVQTKIH